MSRGLAGDLFQERQELLGSMARHAFADDLSGRHVEGGKQRRSPIALVVVRHGAGAALLDGQAGLSAIERLDLALLVDREYQSFLRWGEVKTDDVLDLGDELRVIRGLEGANEMRLEPVLLPDALHAGVPHAYFLLFAIRYFAIRPNVLTLLIAGFV